MNNKFDKDLGFNLRSVFIVFFMIVLYDNYRWVRPFQKDYKQHMESATLEIRDLKAESEIQKQRIRQLSAELYPHKLDTIVLPPRIKMVIKDSVINDTIVNVIWRFTEKKKIIDK